MYGEFHVDQYQAYNRQFPDLILKDSVVEGEHQFYADYAYDATTNARVFR